MVAPIVGLVIGAVAKEAIGQAVNGKSENPPEEVPFGGQQKSSGSGNFFDKILDIFT